MFPCGVCYRDEARSRRVGAAREDSISFSLQSSDAQGGEELVRVYVTSGFASLAGEEQIVFRDSIMHISNR